VQVHYYHILVIVTYHTLLVTALTVVSTLIILLHTAQLFFPECKLRVGTALCACTVLVLTLLPQTACIALMCSVYLLLHCYTGLAARCMWWVREVYTREVWWPWLSTKSAMHVYTFWGWWGRKRTFFRTFFIVFTNIHYYYPNTVVCSCSMCCYSTDICSCSCFKWAIVQSDTFSL
jgi:hypothetical protein